MVVRLLSMRASNATVATQLRAFSGELNGIGFLYARAKELTFIARAADAIAGRIEEASDSITPDTADAVLRLANRVQTIAGANGDPAYAARLTVAANVLFNFMEHAAEAVVI